MPTKKRSGESAWIDPDDAPPLTAEFSDRAEWRIGDQVIRAGRPPVEFPKPRVTLRLDADLLARLRASGPGWQTRLNQAVREWLDEGAA
jgi:uncharacterized protein (DUF4415 family)